MKVKIENSNNLVRETTNMALLNVDKNCISKDISYKKTLERDKKVEEKILELKEEIFDLRKDMKTILELLQEATPH